MTVAKRHALALRKQYNLPGPPSDDDLLRVCEREGLTVLTDCPELVGRVREVLIGDCLCLARDLERKERRWLISHGLGHWVMHEPGAHFFVEDRRAGRGQQERQAEAFAGWFLCSERGRIPPLVLRGGIEALCWWSGAPYLSVENWVASVLPADRLARYALA